MRMFQCISAIGALAVAASSASAALIYNPIVTMIGDGTATVSGQSRTTTLQVYQNTIPAQLAPLSQLAFNSGANGTRLTNSDSATSEGNLSNNPGTADAAAAGTVYLGNIYTYSAGYDAANRTSSVITTATNAPRVVGYMQVTNNTLSSATIPVSQPQASAYDNNNMRSATGDDTATNFWTGGTGTTTTTAGWRYFNTNTQLSTTNSTNVRSTEIRNGELFGSTSSVTRGIYAVASGAGLTTSGNTATLLIGTGGSSSPYEFVLIDDPNNAASTANTFGFDTAYVADDSMIASGGGIQKYVWNGSAWSLAYTLTDGVGGNRGLAGQLDKSTSKVTLWATTAAGDKLEQVTDNGVGGSPFITLATAPTNNVFRGVALTVPEPSSIAILAIAVLGITAPRRRSKSLPVCL